MRRAYPENAPGDWYVELDCCLLCAVPVAVAADLFAWAVDPTTGKEDHCYVLRQPVNAAEVGQIAEAAWAAEVQCIRYRGRDHRVQSLLRARGADHAIDED